MTEQPSILYIEDEEDYQILVTRILSKAGWRVRVAGTGAEGIAALVQERPSLLLLDINLPDTDGYAICRQLRQDTAFQDLPVLMLTVRRRPEEWLKGFSCGANDYLSKPFDPPGLLERVQNGLTGQTLRDTSSSAPEYQLIQAAANGNRAAFEVLLQKYKARLTESLRQTRRTPAAIEDIVSHAFLQAFEKLGEFRGESSFYTWLYRIALNEAILARHQPSAHSFDHLPKDSPLASELLVYEDDSLSNLLTQKESQPHLDAALKEIPPLYRKALQLYFLEELSYEEIARRLRIPLGTVMSRLYKARRLLKESWDAALVKNGLNNSSF
jgi:RNA polymerase sigma-70 factor, ECF subfamily